MLTHQLIFLSGLCNKKMLVLCTSIIGPAFDKVVTFMTCLIFFEGVGRVGTAWCQGDSSAFASSLWPDRWLTVWLAIELAPIIYIGKSPSYSVCPRHFGWFKYFFLLRVTCFVTFFIILLLNQQTMTRIRSILGEPPAMLLLVPARRQWLYLPHYLTFDGQLLGLIRDKHGRC